MKRFFLVLMATIVLLPTKIKADEGMWFLMWIDRLNQRDMEKMGLQLTAEEIYSINNHSLKDAIVQFDGGCTAEIISDQGLVLTNHHCGYDIIAALSTPENNYLRDGFWAKDKSQELPYEGVSVRFFVRMDDVTNRILSKLNDGMSEEERQKAINQETAQIQKENEEGGKYTVSVKSFFQGNEFYYFVYQDFTDVRLVGTPTESIGKFGGDTDNWEWPRHTGDFSMFRVYTDKDGNPAAYSADNVPLKPKHHLPISLGGVQENDFAMILGYPGRTNRWMPAKGVEQNVKFAYPAWVDASRKAMDVMEKYTKGNDAVRLKYASLYAGIANYWKNRQGMIDALNKHKTVKTKCKIEKKFQKWADKKENKAKYGGILDDINAYYDLTNEKSSDNNYVFLAYRVSKLIGTSLGIAGHLGAYESAGENDTQNKEAHMSAMMDIKKDLFENTHIPLEKDMFVELIALYAQKAHNLAPLFAENKSNIREFASKAFDESVFTNEEKFAKLLENPNMEAIKNDGVLQIANALRDQYLSKSEEEMAAEEKYQGAYRKFVAGLREANPDKKYYPDANSTLRLTYGKVRALPKDKSNDAAINNYTTLKGMVDKHKPGDLEFDLSQPLIDLYNKKDFGPYADANGYMPVNFLTDNDITGGNSGSPVLNGKGEMIGLAFDGNIEAMAGDVIFDDKLQRTINVDIRFVLFLIDKYAGAQNIIDELTIVK